MVTTRGKQVKYFETDEEELSEKEELKADARPAKTMKMTAIDDSYEPHKSAAKGKGARLVGKLAGLMMMPIDIFADICRYLGPGDLLRLAQSSRRLRVILMTRESKPIWQDARELNCPTLPPCPPDLCEPQYAAFMFSSTCQGCTSRATKVDYALRTKHCRQCWEENFIPKGDIGYVDECYHWHQFTQGSMRHYRRNGPKPRPYFKKLLLEMIAQQDAITATTSDEKKVAKDQLMKIWSERHVMMIETGKEMQCWQDQQASEKRETLEVLYNRRHQSIKEKLFALDQGFVEADLPFSNPAYVALIRKPAELTPQIWKRIQPSLETLVSEGRAKRIQEEQEKRRHDRQLKLSELYKSLVDQLLTNDLAVDPWRVKQTCPGDSDFFKLPQIATLLDEDTEDITEDAWSAVVEDVRRFALAKRSGLLTVLVEILDHGSLAAPYEPLVEIPLDMVIQVEEKCDVMATRLSLATSAFWCEKHCEVMRYPNVIGHAHANSTTFKCLSSISPGKGDGGLIAALLKSLGSDPETAAFKDTAKLVNYGLPELLCSRCDAKVAPTHNYFDKLVFHYAQHNRWFDQVTAEVASNPEKAYPNRKPSEPLPILRNDHDWTTAEPLVEFLTTNEKRAHAQVKMMFEAMNQQDKDDDDQGIGGEDYKREYWSSERGHRRICKLCPVGLSTPGLQAAVMRLHIKAKHEKEADLEADAEIVAKTYRSNNMWWF